METTKKIKYYFDFPVEILFTEKKLKRMQKTLSNKMVTTSDELNLLNELNTYLFRFSKANF